MENSSKKNYSVDTLLALMSQQLETLLKSVDNIEKKLETKVDLIHFQKLEDSFEEHKKDTQTAMEKQSEKVTEHTIKIGIIGGVLTVLSWVAHFLK
jgi:GTPase involved in cell partitioning and DNA repair